VLLLLLLLLLLLVLPDSAGKITRMTGFSRT
jgi:hypothetical protein